MIPIPDELWQEIVDYLEQREDIEDRPSGAGVRPNREMRLMYIIRDLGLAPQRSIQ